VPISCSLARNAPLRFFVGPLRSFAVFSHTGPVSVGLHDIGPASHSSAAERLVAVGRLRILVASIGFVRNHLTQPEVSVYVTYRPISVLKVGADVGLYSSITSSAIDLQTFRPTGHGLRRNDRHVSRSIDGICRTTKQFRGVW